MGKSDHKVLRFFRILRISQNLVGFHLIINEILYCLIILELGEYRLVCVGREISNFPMVATALDVYLLDVMYCLSVVM